MKLPKSIPQSFQGVLWSTNVANLDFEKDKDYIIHQVLMYGTLRQIQWLFRIYGKSKIKQVFLKRAQNIYSPPAFYFIKNIIFGIKTSLDKKRYVKTLF